MEKQWEMIQADKQRRIRFDTNAFCMMEEITGKSLSELNDRAGIRDIRAMLFCGLFWEDDQLTLEKTGDILDIIMRRDGLDEVTKKLGAALEAATGSVSKKKMKKLKR